MVSIQKQVARRRAAGDESGFTLVELGLVMLLMGLATVIALPYIVRNLNSSGMDIYTELSLWTEILVEQAAFTGEIILIEIDPDERQLRAVQPVVTGESGIFKDAENPVELVEVQSPMFPSQVVLPDNFEFEDIQLPDGTRITRDRFIIVVYPYGWIDPFTIHLLDDNRNSHTGFVNSITGRIDWHDSYQERYYEEEI